jgi:hypothetical protein
MRALLSRLALLACLALPAAAGAGETRAGFDCQPGRDRLLLTYDTAFGRAGKEQLAEKASATQWNPWSLVTYDEEGFIRDMRQEQGVCRLSDGEYRIEIYPYPGNANVQGMCGAWMGAGAKVTKDGETLFDAPFDNSCQRPDEPLIFRALIRPGKRIRARAIPIPHTYTAPGLTFFASCQPKWGLLRLSFGFDADRGQRVDDLLGSDGDAFQVGGSCFLAQGTEYRYALHPFLPTGKACGAARRESARLVIRLEDKTLYDAPFMEDCGGPEAPVIREVLVRVGRKPKAETIPAALFYDPDDSEEGVYSIYNSGPKGGE